MRVLALCAFAIGVVSTWWYVLGYLRDAPAEVAGLEPPPANRTAAKFDARGGQPMLPDNDFVRTENRGRRSEVAHSSHE